MAKTTARYTDERLHADMKLIEACLIDNESHTPETVTPARSLCANTGIRYDVTGNGNGAGQYLRYVVAYAIKQGIPICGVRSGGGTRRGGYYLARTSSARQRAVDELTTIITGQQERLASMLAIELPA